ncbi:MAG: hypothetical protein U0168_03265 [Nannocystaceae bacterium]
MRRACSAFATALALGGCGRVDPLVSDTSAAQTSTSMDTSAGSSSSGSGCGELPLCDLCPDEMALLCGHPCPEGAAPCSNEIGDGMACSGGVWSCVVHPPLGPGCNEVCGLMDACTEAGCSSGLVLALEAAADVWPGGSYGVALDVDAVAQDCSFTVSDDPGDCASPPCVTESTCNAQYLLTEHPQRIEIALGVVMVLGVTVTRDMVELAQQEFEPAYAVAAPNGPGCGPNCAQASATLAVP